MGNRISGLSISLQLAQDVVVSHPHPVAGVDYPRTLQEFNEWFPTEEACAAYLRRLRWPDGFRCPACGGGNSCLTKRGLLQCLGCQRATSVIAGTVFEGTRKPLRTWFLAMWFVTNEKLGGSALGLKRLLGLGSYQTAWAWLHKLRRAMVCPDRDLLQGLVEVDETYVGGVEGGVHGRQTETKAIVAIAIEVHEPKGYGRVRLRRVPDVSASSLVGFVRDVVRTGSVVRTDAWKGYDGLSKAGYERQATNVAASGSPAHVVMPGVHRIASLLKRWLLGTHQGAVRARHLDYYLDEYTFRFNRRSAKARGLLFYRLVEQALLTEPLTYRGIVGGKDRPDHNT
jgi:transposase-like protein